MREGNRWRIWVAFIFAALPALVLPVFMPSLRLFFFAPFIVLMFYKKTLSQSLWIAFGCGLFIDLLAPYPRLGIMAVTYSIASILVYRGKSRFFEDSLLSLPVMTFFFVEVATAVQVVLLKLFGAAPVLSWSWLVTDLGIWPLVDALYAWLWFAFPAYLLRRRPHAAF